MVRVEDVATGAVIVYSGTATEPGGPAVRRAGTLDDVALPPLSTAKLLLAASWWEHSATIDPHARKNAPDVHAMLVDGADAPGRDLALRLRRTVGSGVVLADLVRFGLRPCSSGELLRPFSPPACFTLSARATDGNWASALSIGEADIAASIEQLSLFLRAVANNGTLPASYRDPERGVMSAATAKNLQSAMLDAVDHGSAKGIRERLGDTWKIGGKTGTGPGGSQPYDGIFAGLVFDESGEARYTVICYVRHGGPGGGVPAEVAAHVVKFTLGL